MSDICQDAFCPADNGVVLLSFGRIVQSINRIMKKYFLALLSAFLSLPFCLSAQFHFQKSATVLTPAQCYSGSAIAVLDMNGDGLDDIARLNQGVQLSVELQTAPGQPFTHIPVGNVSGDSQWGMCAADVDNNGFPDVLCGGEYDGIKVAMANADGSAYRFVTLNAPGTFVQGVNFADINNDGWLDAFVCHDDGAARVFGNDGAGHLVYQPLWIDLATVPPSDNSGNYGSVWSDVDNDGDPDLYIAHCRQGVDDPTDPRRINQLFLNNGDGTFTQDVTNASGLRIGAQSWTADFGDIDNDGFLDMYLATGNPSYMSLVPNKLFKNLGGRKFADVTVSSRTGNLQKGHGVAFADLDNDGDEDIYVDMGGAYRGDAYPAAFYMNPGQGTNNWICIKLEGTQSNRAAIGAKVTLKFRENGQQRMVYREVNSGGSFGCSPLRREIGVGKAEVIDEIAVQWPVSGKTQVFKNVRPEQFIHIKEDQNDYEVLALNKLVFKKADGTIPMCVPVQ